MSTEKIVENNIDSTEIESTIKNYTLFGGLAGMIPIVGLDIVAVTAVQTAMTRKLCEMYEVEFEEEITTAVLSSFITSVVGKIVSSGMEAAINPYSAFGKYSKSFTGGSISAYLTFTSGMVIHTHFKSGGNLSNLKASMFIDYILDQIKSGELSPSQLMNPKTLLNYLF